jgi:hypothetical protein
MSGIVSETDNVPLNFYVAVKLFNDNNTDPTKRKDIGAVGAATSTTSPFGTIAPFTTTSNSGTTVVTGTNQITPGTTPVTTNKTPLPNETLETTAAPGTLDPPAANQNFPLSNAATKNPASINQEPGVLAARKLFIWIVFKTATEVLSASLPVNPSANALPSGGTLSS